MVQPLPETNAVGAACGCNSLHRDDDSRNGNHCCAWAGESLEQRRHFSLAKRDIGGYHCRAADI